MVAEPFQYTIHTKEIAEELTHQGFISVLGEDGAWTVIAPENLSATKARKIISTTINLYKVAKELGKAQNQYDKLVDELSKLTESTLVESN